tara:strand:- start:65 stop:322 length:258 start_codon:yes stop_codon:yes gene_type:complete
MTKEKQIHPSEYASNDYWKNDFLHEVHYKKGSRHNRIGMWIMWIFYGIISVQIVHLLTVLPWIFPALMGTGLALAGYVIIRVNWE